MLDKIRLPTKRYQRSFKHYKCLSCNVITTQRSAHLERHHDVDRFYLRALEGETPEAITFFEKWFIETQEPLTGKKINYNPPLKDNEKFGRS